MKKLTRCLSTLLAVTMVSTAVIPAMSAIQPNETETQTNATYYNNATINAADPYVLYDEDSGYYYAYSTAGASKGYYFGVYRSPDLATWEKASNGAIASNDPNQWGNTWFWAPEVYHNEDTGLYYIFYSAMMKPELREEAFGFADFGEACKIGVAVSDKPEGPFSIVGDMPIDYSPYDPDYYDVNQIMDSAQMKPPATQEEGMTAPKGTYIPTIDANVFFDDDGRIYLYYSRNAYRNWVWDDDLGKYIEESNIYAVELNTEWWSDPTGSTQPTIKEEYVNATKGEDDAENVRKDGFVPIINYGSEKQSWENAHVNDYEKYNGAKKDRRWAEGSTTLKYYYDKDGDGEKEPIYYILYSCNNYENENYGVGYAVADNPLGPWDKYELNPVIHQDEELGMYSTGHGSFITTPDGTESYYVYHGRSSTTGGRRLYTDRMYIDETKLDENGLPVIWVDQSTSDRPVPSGTAPYSIQADTDKLYIDQTNEDMTANLNVDVKTAAGAKLPLANVLNRVDAKIADSDIAEVAVKNGSVTVTGKQKGETTLTLTYQRLSSSGEYYDVTNGDEFVSVSIPVLVAETNATYYNNATMAAADPYVLYDKDSGYYYAYSTDGASKGYYFGVYRSPDLVTWEKASSGAISSKDPNQWGNTWFWAPEVYHNEDTGLYYIFYSAMMKPELREEAFGFADFGEACKIGVAVSDKPEGPFNIVGNRPIDYSPYDPDYYDVNQIMDSAQMKPPATQEEGMTAPKGTYIPTIDANVFFDDNGKMYLYYSRNAYRNWVWDDDLGKYIEESNIYAVELNTEWWSDPTGSTQPTIKEEYVNATKGEDDAENVRKDGFVPIINYGSEKQSWENAHVNDYEKYNGKKKDRRWAEGSTTLKYYYDKDGDGEKEPIYYILYSCNNYENENYGVGYAVADNPLGPWDKYDLNPVISQSEELGMYSTGHGSFITTPDGTESYYVYHGRSSTTGGRRLYTDRMYIDETKLDENGLPVIWVDQSTSDRPVPSGTAPYSIQSDEDALFVDLAADGVQNLNVDVKTAAGAKLPLANVLNRVDAKIADSDIADVTVKNGSIAVTGKQEGVTTLTLTYQRLSSDGDYYDVKNGGELVSIDIPVEVANAVMGDVDGNGVIGVTDLLSIKSYILGRSDFSAREAYQADFNKDGKVNIFDLVAIKLYILRG